MLQGDSDSIKAAKEKRAIAYKEAIAVDSANRKLLASMSGVGNEGGFSDMVRKSVSRLSAQEKIQSGIFSEAVSQNIYSDASNQMPLLDKLFNEGVMGSYAGVFNYDKGLALHEEDPNVNRINAKNLWRHSVAVAKRMGVPPISPELEKEEKIKLKGLIAAGGVS